MVRRFFICPSQRSRMLSTGIFYWQDNMADNCSRASCENELRNPFYRIWNNAGNDPPHRDYCIPCGRKIKEASPDLKRAVVWVGVVEGYRWENEVLQPLHSDREAMRNHLMGLATAYMMAKDEPAPRVVRSAIEKSMLVFTAGLEDHSEIVDHWQFPCFCALCRSYA